MAHVICILSLCVPSTLDTPYYTSIHTTDELLIYRKVEKSTMRQLLLQISFLICHSFVARSQTTSNDSVTYGSLADIFPALKSLEIDRPIKHPPPGLQHFPRCCLQAIQESYQIIDGEVYNLPDKFIGLTAPQLNSTQFPCGAKYQDDNDEGAAEVKVPYRWCKDNCDGWQRSSSKALNEWVQPFVGFILPSAVFCLHVGIFLLPRLRC